MGIPGLLGLLQPYGVESPLTGESVVIDGPAMAYHIMYECITKENPSPSYEVVCNATVAWLDQLVDHGVKM
jgi:hypothetical protein